MTMRSDCKRGVRRGKERESEREREGEQQLGGAGGEEKKK